MTEHCPYKLYEELRGGESLLVTNKEGKTYTFTFKGPKLGFGGYLEARQNSDLSTLRFGPGWGSEAVGRALRQLAAGWESRQFPRYEARPYEPSLEHNR